MSSAPGGRPAVLVLALVIVGSLVGWIPAPLVTPTQPAGADPVDCSSGVIVAVNGSPWNNTVDAVCDLAPVPANAAYALQTAGFDPVGVASYGLAFVCQIDGDPPDDSCQTTPPADAYWSFWYADSGQDRWTYSTSGAVGLEPQPGSVDYWIFGGQSGTGQPPGPTPEVVRSATQRAVASPAPAPIPTTTQPSSAAGPTGGTDSGSASPAPATSPPGPASAAAPATTMPPASPPGASHRTATSPRPAGATSSARSGGRTPPTESAGTKTTGRPGPVKIVSVAPALARQPAGSPFGLIFGGIAVAALAGVAGFIAVRRRRVG